jgi:hypothetical protein
MNARTVARMLSLGRIGFGVALMALPEQTTEKWIGRQSRRPVPQMLTRALGARDLGLGAATFAASGGGTLTPLLVAGLLADGTDLTATLLEREHLPKLAVPLIAAAAGTGIVMGAVALAAGSGSKPDPA